MKLFKKVSPVLLLMLALAVLPALSEGLDAVDMMGRSVQLPAPARKVVALTAADVEILYAIGAGDTLVGRGEFANYPEAALAVPAVSSGSQTNIEQIIALGPDLVIMATMNQQKEQVEQLEKAGIPVAATDAKDIAGTYQAIRLIGELTGKAEEAGQLTAQMEAGFEALRVKAAHAGVSGSVYFEVSPLQWGLWTAGGGTFMQELADILGLQNAFSDVAGWAEISQEQVLARNPDYIVTVGMYFGEGPTPVEEIKSRTGWEALKALQNDKVWNADADAIGRPGPRLLHAGEQLLEFLLPAEVN